MRTCPRCSEPLASGQEYCLVCGARVADPSGRLRRTGPGWGRRALATGLVALAAAGVAVALTGNDADATEVVTAIGGFATAPVSTTGDAPVGPSGIAEWPADQDGWTIALASLPQTAGRAPALARAKRARARDLPQVGVLDSSRYASLHPGYWIVFSGVYSSEAEATSALETARKVSRTAVVRRVVP